MTGGISIPTSSGIVSEDDTLGTNPASEIRRHLKKENQIGSVVTEIHWYRQTDIPTHTQT